MTPYETGRYGMFKRVCRFGEVHREFFPEVSDARKTFAQVAKHVEDLDALARARQDAMEHGWRRKAEARRALRARLRVLARIAYDEGLRVPGADALFPFPSRRSDGTLLHTGKLFVSACTNASRTLSRSTTAAAGSSGAPPQTTESGSGSSQLTSGRCSRPECGSELGCPSPVGIGRRFCPSSAVRQTFVAIRYIQVRTDERFSNRSYARQARK